MCACTQILHFHCSQVTGCLQARGGILQIPADLCVFVYAYVRACACVFVCVCMCMHVPECYVFGGVNLKVSPALLR